MGVRITERISIGAYKALPIHRKFNMTVACQECNAKDTQVCPYCGHNCDLSAYTYNSDEDAFCNHCQQICLQSPDGSKLEKLPE